MEKIYRNIKTGGLDNVDDILSTGGFALTFSGGKGNRVKKIVGNQTSVHIRDKMLEWGAFMENYPDVDNLDTAGQEAMCKTVKLVMDSRECLNSEDTLEILKSVYRLPDEKISQMFIRRFNFGLPTVEALKSIFVNWVHYLETRVIAYIKARENYIEQNKTSDFKNDVVELLKNWSAIDKYYKIDSSSPILLYTSFPQTPYVLPWLRGTFTESDVWDIYPLPFYWSVKGVPSTLKLEKKVANFTYLGFCPMRPKYRLNALFGFPLKELNKATIALGGVLSTNETIMCEVMNKIKFSKVSIQIPKFKVPEIARSNEPNLINTQQKIKWYVEEIIKIYQHLHSHFKEVESYYTEIARQLSEIGIEMEEL